MEVNRINLYSPKFNNYTALNKQPQEKPEFQNPIQTSLYNQKGLNVSFGCLAKGIDEAEEVCIKLLRKARIQKISRTKGASPRKFDEQDIKEIITSIRKIEKPEDKTHIIEEVLTIEDDQGLKPEKGIIKKLVKLIADKPEEERFALLEYAENDLKTVYEPLNAFINLPKEKQNGLIGLLKEITDVNETKLFKSNQAQTETIDSLYEHFREVLYAEEELLKLPPAKANDFKLQTIDVLNNDIKYYINVPDNFADPKAQNKIINVAHKVFSYFIENTVG